MEKKELNKAVKEIKRMWNTCEHILNDSSMIKYGNRLLRLTTEESKSHNRFTGNNDRGITIKTEAQFFALKRVLNYVFDLHEIKKPELDNYHHIQTSVSIRLIFLRIYPKVL